MEMFGRYIEQMSPTLLRDSQLTRPARRGEFWPRSPCRILGGCFPSVPTVSASKLKTSSLPSRRTVMGTAFTHRSGSCSKRYAKGTFVTGFRCGELSELRAQTSVSGYLPRGVYSKLEQQKEVCLILYLSLKLRQ